MRKEKILNTLLKTHSNSLVYVIWVSCNVVIYLSYAIFDNTFKF